MPSPADGDGRRRPDRDPRRVRVVHRGEHGLPARRMVQLPADVGRDLAAPSRNSSTDTSAPRGPVTRWLDTTQPEALFVLSAVAQYAGAVIAVALFDEVDPQTVAWFRVIGAAVAVVVASRAWRERWTRPELVAAGLFGVATALMNTFFYLGIDRVDLGIAVTIEFIGPITVAAVATRSRRNAVALLFAIAGVLDPRRHRDRRQRTRPVLHLPRVGDVGGLHRDRLAGRTTRPGRVGSRDRVGDRCRRDHSDRGAGQHRRVERRRDCSRCASSSGCSRTRSATASTSSRCDASRCGGSRCCSRSSR